MGLENHRCRCGRLINVHVNHVNVHEFVATRYSPTYKANPMMRRIVGFLFLDNNF